MSLDDLFIDAACKIIKSRGRLPQDKEEQIEVNALALALIKERDHIPEAQLVVWASGLTIDQKCLLQSNILRRLGRSLIQETIN